MKKIALALIIAASVAGCNTTGNGPKLTPEQAAAKVQAYTRAACGFLPTVATVLAILKKSSAAESVVTIGGSICAAVAPTTMQTFISTVPMVKGVVIRGSFVK